MAWQIACDFDGTIATCDVTDSILDRFALPEWQAIERDWKEGRIGSRECMARQVDLVRVVPAELDAHLDTIEIDPGFPAFAAACRLRGVPLTVVSDGIDYAIRRVLARSGLDDLPVVANHLEFLPGGRCRLTSPHARNTCQAASGTCKCATLEGMAPAAARPLSLLIGDGASDFCGAGSADLVFAKDKLLAHARRQGLPHVAFRDFAEATGLLHALLDAPEQRAATWTAEPVHA